MCCPFPQGGDRRTTSMCESITSTVTANSEEEVSLSDDDNDEDNGDDSDTASAPSPTPLRISVCKNNICITSNSYFWYFQELRFSFLYTLLIFFF